jgi:hypothetical protein
MTDAIVNKVAQSGLITLNLEEHLPKGETMLFDLKDYLFMELILKEKDFREALKNLDWTAYNGKNVAITCTADAIIPLWAYMLVITYLQPVAADVYVGTADEMQKHLFLKKHCRHRRSAICRSAHCDKRLWRYSCRCLCLCRADKASSASGEEHYVR